MIDLQFKESYKYIHYTIFRGIFEFWATVSYLPHHGW